jgi:hypothetical protein
MKLKLRRSQLIVPFGVGAIVNMRDRQKDESLMTCGIDLWDKKTCEVLYDERLQKRLKVRDFRTPPSAEKVPKGVPFVRFPRWFFCPKCRKFQPIDIWEKRWVDVKDTSFDGPKCYDDGTKLVPARFIVACARGHIDDFPWVEWVHRGSKCSAPSLKILTGGRAAGLGGIRIECEKCGENANMAGAFNDDAFEKIIKYDCTGNKPWQCSSEKCDAVPRTLQRGGSNVYFAKVVSSINIPPFSDNICDRITSTMAWKLLWSQEGAIDDDEEMKTMCLNNIAKEIGEEKSKVTRIVERMLQSSTGEIEEQSENEYRYDEYRAFLGGVDKGQIDARQFSVEILKGEQYQLPGINKVVLAHRLRELRALVAFSRINPVDRDELGLTEEDGGEQSIAVPVRDDKRHDWFPAIEVRGEGIFLSFDSESLTKWSKNKVTKERAAIINERYAKLCKTLDKTPRNINPKFLFLHTFSHILIRQLSFECGYASAALRERIYCNENENEQEMAGILIYTSSGDSEGTLGGLVRQGRPDRLPAIVERAVRQASWCSSDPVCIESKGQGIFSLNLAACYACVLLPETSCEEFNKFLDRTMVVGLPNSTNVGFFEYLL